MPLTIRKLTVALALLASQSSCYSFNVLGRARTVGRGHAELTVAPGASGTGTLHGDTNVRPSFELGARYGLSDRFDAGLRLGDSGALASLRAQLVRSPSEHHGFEMLLAPGLAYTVTDKLALELPVSLGLNLPGRHQIVLTPRAVYQLRFGVGDLDHPAQFVFVGATLGFVWQVTGKVALAPEVSALTSVYQEPGFVSYTQAGPALRAALGILWDL